MTKRLMAAALLAGLGLGPPVASATVIAYTAGPANGSESQPAATHETGFAAITLDDVLATMQVVVSVSEFTDNATAAHTHCCNAVTWKGTPSVIPTVPKFLEFPFGVTYRSYADIINLNLGSDAIGPLEFGVNHGAH